MSATTGGATETADSEQPEPAVGAETGARSRDARQPAAATLEKRHETNHWQIASVAVFLAVGVAVLAEAAALLLAAVVGVGMLAYRQISTVESPSLAVSRSMTDREPDPGDVITVETTVRNVGESTLPDCRLFDGVPPELSVVDGSPRLATMLRPGESCTISYDLEAERGAHKFGGVDGVISDLAGTVEAEYQFRAEETLRCVPTVRPIQTTLLRSMTTPYAGRLSTDESGEGLEFHATREYRPGDSLRRIDWNQYAATGELATLEFRTERAAAVVVVVDVRPLAYSRGASTDSHAADRCVEAASRLFVTLLDEDHRAGFATFGPDYWLAPDAGSEHRHRGIEAVATEPALSPSPSEGTFPVRLRLRWLRRRFPEDAQVVFCSPLLDRSSRTIVQVLESYGHEVTVVSPDPTGTATTGERTARLERRNRITDIHEFGVPVVDWRADEQLDIAMARTVTGWSR